MTVHVHMSWQQQLRQWNSCGLNIFLIPPYSLDLAPCDHDIFGSLKEAVLGHSSIFDDEVKKVADLDSGATKSFFKVMKKLVE